MPINAAISRPQEGNRTTSPTGALLLAFKATFPTASLHFRYHHITAVAEGHAGPSFPLGILLKIRQHSLKCYVMCLHLIKIELRQ